MVSISAARWARRAGSTWQLVNTVRYSFSSAVVYFMAWFSRWWRGWFSAVRARRRGRPCWWRRWRSPCWWGGGLSGGDGQAAADEEDGGEVGGAGVGVELAAVDAVEAGVVGRGEDLGAGAGRAEGDVLDAAGAAGTGGAGEPEGGAVDGGGA